MVYTRKGDKGETSLVGGKRVLKCDIRVECYGTLDELNSHIGLARDMFDDEESKKELLLIQHILFNAESIIACESKEILKTLPRVDCENIKMLEDKIDIITKELPKLKYFILPTGDVLSSQLNVARTVCRRAERLLVNMNQSENVDENVLMYINRLSDYLFVLARKVLKDKNKDEIYWQP